MGEIGGNKILLEDGGTRVFLDFGMSFKQSGRYFSEFLQPRKCNCMGDFFATGLLPDLEGVYRRDYLDYMGCPGEERGVDAVLLSHAHMDHAAYIHHLRRDIPIYMTPGSRAILDTLEETGSSSFSDYLHHKAAFKIRRKKRGDGYTRLKGSRAETRRPVHTVRSGEAFNVGSLEITPYKVDHSLPGAAAYLIHTSECTVLYTGDFRFHGYRREETRRMVEAAMSQDTDVVITEGTRVDEKSGTTEKDVLEHATQIIRETHGLAVVNFPSRDLARLKTFQDIAKKTGRKLVLSFKQAYILEQFSEIGGNYPGLDDPQLCFFANRKSWGLIGRDDYPDNIREQDYRTWEREYLNRKNTVNYRDLKNHQDEYMFYCNYFQLNELIDIEPSPGSRYIRSITEPFNEEMWLNLERAKNWLNLYKLDLYGLDENDQIHASGHASGPEIFKMLEHIKPKTIYPVHTETPKTFIEHFEQAKTIESGVKYSI